MFLQILGHETQVLDSVFSLNGAFLEILFLSRASRNGVSSEFWCRD